MSLEKMFKVKRLTYTAPVRAEFTFCTEFPGADSKSTDALTSMLQTEKKRLSVWLKEAGCSLRSFIT